MDKVQSFIKSIHWKAYFILNESSFEETQPIFQHFGFKAKHPPPLCAELYCFIQIKRIKGTLMQI